MSKVKRGKQVLGENSLPKGKHMSVISVNVIILNLLIHRNYEILQFNGLMVGVKK